MIHLLPSRTAIAAAIASAIAVLLGWARLRARQTQRLETELEDLRHAQELETRVADDRADPDRLRPYEGAGYRD